MTFVFGRKRLVIAIVSERSDIDRDRYPMVYSATARDLAHLNHIGSGPSDVILKDGRVETVKPAGRATPDVGSLTANIAATMVDIPIYGAKGIELQSLDITPAGSGNMTRGLLSTSQSPRAS